MAQLQFASLLRLLIHKATVDRQSERPHRAVHQAIGFRLPFDCVDTAIEGVVRSISIKDEAEMPEQMRGPTDVGQASIPYASLLFP